MTSDKDSAKAKSICCVADKGLPRSTQPPPPIESSQKESEIAEDSQTLLPQASAVQESTPSSASPRDSLSLDSSYSLMENRGSVPNVGKPLPPSTGNIMLSSSLCAYFILDYRP